MRAAIRLLFALTLMAWGQFVSAATTYYWSFGSGKQYSSPTEACLDNQKSINGFVASKAEMISSTAADCYFQVSGNPNWNNSSRVQRYGDSCEEGGVYNPSTGQCDGPKDCKSKPPLTVSTLCTYIPALKTSACPSVVNVDGCEYVKTSGAGQKCEFQGFSGSNQTYCYFKAEASGAASASGENLPEENYTPEPDAENPDRCLQMGTNKVCLSPDNAGCDLYNGKPWCYQTGDKCGTINGQFTCLPETGRQCTYVNGQLSCINTGNPEGSKVPSLTPPTSSDHPNNGGNNDGRDDNDPLPAGSGGGSSGQGAKDAATNKTVQDGADQITTAVEKGNGLLKDIYDGLFGKDYDNSGDGSDSEAEAKGGEAGNDLAKKIGDQADALDKEREEKLQDELDKINGTVNDWFGNGFGLDSALERIIPSATGCSVWTYQFSLKNYSTTIRIDTCVLSRLRSLLEWIVWAGTVIGVWKIFYAGLRLKDSKAAKGGF